MPGSAPRPVVERMSGAKRHRGETEPHRTRRARAGSETLAAAGLPAVGQSVPEDGKPKRSSVAAARGGAGRSGSSPSVASSGCGLGCRPRPRRKRLDFSDAARPGTGHRPGRGAQAQPSARVTRLRVAVAPCGRRSASLFPAWTAARSELCGARSAAEAAAGAPRGPPGLPAPRRPPRPLSFGLPRESGLGTVPVPRGRSQAWPRRCLAETQQRATGWPPGQVSADCCVKARE